VLFVTTKIGFGHERVSNVLAEEVRSFFPDCDVKIATYFDFFSKRFEKFINSIYVYGLRWFPNIFAYIYLAQKHYRRKGIDFWSRFLERKYAKTIRNYNPNVIIITQGLACQWLGELKKQELIDVPLVAVITDFVAHPFWICPEIDFYIVANESIKNDLITRGINYKKIAVSGVPVDPSFLQAYNKTSLMTKLGLSSNSKKVMVMGGGWGLGGLEEILLSIEKLDMPLDVLVITGKNRKLYRRLRNKNFNVAVHVYGKVDNISELMAVSDIVVTKAGGVTISEVLASGLPAVIWDIIPGQEEANADYVMKNRVGIKANNFKEASDAVKKLLLDDTTRNEMSLHSKTIGRPNSAMDAVSYIKILAKK
jgi:processive 1,2-diacylglycerol beta-glucosyltransferase